MAEAFPMEPSYDEPQCCCPTVTWSGAMLRLEDKVFCEGSAILARAYLILLTRYRTFLVPSIYHEGVRMLPKRLGTGRKQVLAESLHVAPSGNSSST